MTDEMVSLRDYFTKQIEDLEQRQEDFIAQADRRYAEVAIEREKALKIKEQADRDAMQLSRDAQTYKDEQANDLRQQLSQERGTYASRTELNTLKERIDRSEGAAAGMRTLLVIVTGALGLIVTVSTIYAFLRETPPTFPEIKDVQIEGKAP